MLSMVVSSSLYKVCSKENSEKIVKYRTPGANLGFLEMGKGGGLIQGTNLLGRDVLQHAKHDGTWGV